MIQSMHFKQLRKYKTVFAKGSKTAKLLQTLRKQKFSFKRQQLICFEPECQVYWEICKALFPENVSFQRIIRIKFGCTKH